MLKVKKLFSVLLVSIMMLSLYTLPASAEESEAEDDSTAEEIYTSEYGLIYDDYVPNLPVREEEESYTTLTSYDPRITNSMTPIKNQNPLKVCWSFTSIALLESANYVNNGIKYTYSEEALRFVTSNELLNQFTGSSDIGYYTRSAGGGGNIYSSLSYLTSRNSPVSDMISWNAPSLDKDVPYNTSNTTWPDKVHTSYANAYASDFIFIEFDEYNVKDYVLEYGGVYLSFHVNNGNMVTNSFYTDTLNPVGGHAVEIVGWDDNYSKSNFSEGLQPANNGAWLVKNSWGNENDDGYYWISYEDVSLNCNNSAAVITDVDQISKNEYMLYYDYLTMSRNSGIRMEYSISADNEDVYIANVYDVSNLVDDYGSINKVMLYSADIDAFYRIYVVPMTAEETMPSLTELGSVKAYGTIGNEGYLTAEFSSPVSLSEGTEKVAVVVRYTGDSSSYNTLEIAQERRSTLCKPVSHTGESYYYKDGSWIDISGGEEVSQNGNFCIRPTLVRRTSVTQDSTISSNNLTYTGSDVTVDLNLNGNLLYSIKENGNTLLYEDNQFVRDEDSVTFKSSYLSSLAVNQYKNIVFEFTDGATQSLRITRKEAMPNVSISGKTAIGQTLTAQLSTDTSTGITYQWQASSDGTTWIDISGATANTLAVDNTMYLKYIRVKISSTSDSSYVYPEIVTSASIANKIILYGDVNLDGAISINDSTTIQRYIAGSTLNAEQLVAGDVNGDGVVNINDATLISRYLSDSITSFPVESN